ncbi:MAG TPA: TlpA disulfide reductase family protein [Hymenobacter sp.]|jgi:thiol-disulfide isomerase/thioredoxin|uniref:TlpA family protein disulfide reductase n=1 Tax=Hymenobacter sp. TaxID=1898978 RepID=UPI002ED9DED8
MALLLPALVLSASLRLLAGSAAPVAAPPAPAVLSGHLDHAPAGDSVRVSYGRKQAKAPLSPSGDFKLVVPDLKAGTPAELSYARQRTRVYLSPGDQLHLTLDFPRFDETLRYTGRGADVNNYLAQSLWKFEYGPPSGVPRPKVEPTTTPAQIRQMADAYRAERKGFLATYAKAHPLPADFQRNAILTLDLQWATSLLDYPAYYRYANKQPPVLPAAYYDFMAQLPLKKLDQYLKVDRGIEANSALLHFLTVYSGRLLPAGTLSTDPAEAPRIYAQATADFGTTATRDRAMYQLFSWKLDDNLEGVLAAYPTFRTQNRDSTFARDLRQMLSKRLLIRPGLPAPAFTLVNNEGKQVSLSDFKGKVVYLDFWGTWCGPCMKEMPASLALRKRFEGQDVVFVYIAVGDKEDKWQQVLAAEKLTGVGSAHLRVPNSESTRGLTGITSDYQVNKYPTYWLIGRDGRIVTSNAPRPSDPDAVGAALTAALAR